MIMARIIKATILLMFSFIVNISAQNEPKKPDNVSDAAWEHLMNIYKYQIPDSFVGYGPTKDGGWLTYEKHIFKYDKHHHPIYIDVYRMFDDGYRFVDRSLDTYDSITGKMRSHDMHAMERKYVDSFSTHTQNMTFYDEQGRMIRYEDHMAKQNRDSKGSITNDWYVSNIDSSAYAFNKFKVPVSLNSYNYKYADKKWSLRINYTADSIDKKGLPGAITVSEPNKNDKLTPIYKYHAIKWAVPFIDFFGIDTSAKEYVMANYDGKKWTDSLKRVTSFDKNNRVDTTVLYTFENGVFVPYNKDVYTYDNIAGHASEQHFVYLEKQWVLRSGKRRTVKVDPQHMDVEIIGEIYSINDETNKGAWSVEYKILAY